MNKLLAAAYELAGHVLERSDDIMLLSHAQQLKNNLIHYENKLSTPKGRKNTKGGPKK